MLLINGPQQIDELSNSTGRRYDEGLEEYQAYLANADAEAAFRAASSEMANQLASGNRERSP